MRRGYSRITAAVVTQGLCELVVSHLALTDYKRRLPASLLARLLLLAGALGRSLSFVAQRCDGAPSDETLRRAVLYNLPGPEILEARLVAALHSLLPPRLLRRPLPAALDFHQRPFYGEGATPGVRGGKREAGTDLFWTYATLVLPSRGTRHTVGLCRVVPGEPQQRAVRRLLAQAGRAGVRLRYLLMDRAFHDAAVIAALQERGTPFVVPLTRRGDERGAAGTARFFRRGQASGWSSHSWSARVTRWDERRQKEVRGVGARVTVGVCVAARGGGRRPLVFAASRVAWPPRLVAKRYRARFGIEASYRQLGEGLAATTSKDARVRLLLVGLALLLRQCWCLGVVPEGFERAGRGATLRLVELRTWLLIQLTRELGFRLERLTDPPAPPTPTAA
jgi:hypothetical protein